MTGNDDKYLIDIYGNRLKSEELKIDDKTSEKNLPFLIRKTDKYLKKSYWDMFFKWYKNDMATILLMISGIGSLVQIYYLSKINLAFIRFFSVTQLIADGTQVFLAMLTVAIMYKIFEFCVDSTPGDKIWIIRNIPDETNYYTIIVTIFETFILIFITFYFIPIIQFPFKEVLFTSFYFFTLYNSFWTISNLIDFYNKNINQFKFIRALKFLAILNYSIVTIISLTYIFKVSYRYLEYYKAPYDTINYKNINEKVIDDYGQLDSYKLLYLNDKYLFLKIKLKGNDVEENLIYKTDDILFD